MYVVLEMVSLCTKVKSIGTFLIVPTTIVLWVFFEQALGPVFYRNWSFLVVDVFVLVLNMAYNRPNNQTTHNTLNIEPLQVLV